jgi:S-adenosylmethionine decarboxylase proenzyme
MALPPQPRPAHGVHLLLEYRDCAPAVLDDPAELERVLYQAAAAIGAKVLTAAFHRFAPHGVTGFLLLEESHLSIHTWPEQAYAAVDLFSCGATEPELAVDVLRTVLRAARVCQLRVARGELSADSALRVVR